jgi:thioredoxin-dependent peroxiredoxin
MALLVLPEDVSYPPRPSRRAPAIRPPIRALLHGGRASWHPGAVIKVGQKAPEFRVKTTSGEEVTNDTYRGKILVLYFFPKAFTTGCTIESKQFRDAAPELRALGAEVVGVSVDSLETQCAFAKSFDATFDMIGDQDKAVSRAFDVLWPLIGKAQRVTFVMDGEGVVRAVFHHEVLVGRHLDDVRTFVQKLTAK